MFYGREKELKLIKETFKNPNNSILIYGKRRIGKTTLIKEAIKNDNYIYFECMEDTIENNVESFVKMMNSQGIDVPSFISFKNFIDVFSYLNSLNNRLIIVIDEYPYLKSLNNAKVVDSMFQNIIDNHITNLNIIISGSSMKIMTEILQEGNPLFGRFKETLLIEEFNYAEASKYYYNELSCYDKVAFFSVFGGSPYINEMIDEKLSLKENIKNTFLKRTGNVYNYADNLLLSDSSNQIQAKRIMNALGNSKKKYSELESILDKEKTGKINVSLKSLVQLKLINKVYPINRLDDSKKSYYEINDNALRFFYTYVAKNKNNLEILDSEAFYDEFIEKTIMNYVSHRFESIVRTYFSLLVRSNKLRGIKNIGTYYYDDSKNKINGEFDVALDTVDGYAIYEVKYLKDKLKINQAEIEIKQINNIRGINVNKIGFVSINGFDFDDKKIDLIDGTNIYKI